MPSDMPSYGGVSEALEKSSMEIANWRRDI
jgi:hypothetical protein